MRLKLIGALALFSMLSLNGMAADDKSKDKTQHGKTMTGCLSTGANANEYVFVEEGTGKRVTVAGNPDLSKHAANHKVKITTTDAAPASNAGGAVTVSKIEHVSDSCSAK